MSNALPLDLTALRQFAERPALSDGQQSLTYQQLAEQISHLASWLQQQPAQRFAISGPNSISWIIADLALAVSNKICVPLPRFFSAAQQAYILDTAAIEIILETEPLAGSLVSPVPGLWYRQVLLSDNHPVPAFPMLSGKVTFTSGTTGSPKGVCLSWAQQAATLAGLVKALGAEFSAEAQQQLQQQLSHTKPEQLQPIISPMPAELTQVVTAINQLLAAIEQHMQREKRFIADASHELRTPLSIINLHAQNLAQTPLNTEQDAAVSAIKLGSERMSHLTNQLLALARLEHPKLTLERLPLADLLEASLHLVSPALLQRVVWQLSALDACRDAGYQVLADRSLLQVALRNLFENAAKYAPADSEVRLTLKLLPEQILQLTLSNDCPVTLENSRLGERFYRAPEHQLLPGSGLGLSIVRRILELHHWRYQNQQTDQTFSFTMLFSPAH
jgi:signal transduction histidine kinase